MKAPSRETIARSYLVVAALLVPWVAYLTVSLPQRSISRHYDVTWIGFDIVLILIIGRTGWFAHRKDPRVVLSAAAGAALLLADAWFDTTTSADGSAFWQAVVLALVLEVPGAILSALLAYRGVQALARGEARAHSRARTSSAASTSPE